MQRKSDSWADSWDRLLIASIVLIAGVCAQSQRAVYAEDLDLEGPIIKIAPDEAGQEMADLATEPKTRIVKEPSYWIGIRGRSIESEVLRTHLQLAEDMGVVVEEVLPDSPAAKAGLRKHDIILRAGGDAVDNMTVMQQHVRAGGEQPIELRIIRLGKPEKLVIVPEMRPEQFQDPVGGRGADRWKALGENPHDFLEQMLRGRGIHNRAKPFPMDLQAELQRVLPRDLGGIGRVAADDPIVDRIQELERKLQDLQERLEQDPDVQ